MHESPPRESDPAADRGWIFTRALFALLFALATAALSYALWVGFVPADGGERFSSREERDEYVAPLLGLAMFWLFGLGYLLQQLRIWRQRHGARGAGRYRRALQHRERQGSRVGNALAWIIAVPFALLMLLALVAIATN